MRDLAFGWEPEGEVPPWLATELMLEPLVREYGFPWEYFEAQEPRRVEVLVELLELRARRRRAEAARNASR